MVVESILHMVGGVGANSYSANSQLQRKALTKMKSVITTSVREVCNDYVTHDQIYIADFGCSSGPNTLQVTSDVLIAITDSFRQMNRCLPDVHSYLNDLPGNDFNTLFRSISPFHDDHYNNKFENGKIDEVAPLYVYGVAASFFQRVLPRNSIHFVHSSYSLHYLSQDPLANKKSENGMVSNGRNIYITKESPTVVIEAYREQYQSDFIQFLKSRAEEVVVGGQMVLLFLSRHVTDPIFAQSSAIWAQLGAALSDMVSEGLIEEEDLERFNLPFYTPLLDEVRATIQKEGSFNILQSETFNIHWDPSINIESCDGMISNCNNTMPRVVARYMRAAVEPLLVKHFRDIDLDQVFERFAMKLLSVPHEIRFHVSVILRLKKAKAVFA